ncbi:MAG: hypothetical protein ACI9VR_001023 [Cognaticolwellia sp.]|jgi:hypothetical protein
MITALLLSCLPSVQSVLAEDPPTPQVVFTRPAQDQMIPAGPAAIIVEFDVGMDARSFSWGPGTDTALVPTKEPHWMHDTIWSFNADLEPNTTYSFVLNPGQERGFVSLNGAPAETTVVRFSTSDLSSDEQPIARHQIATDRMIQALRTQYAYRAQREVDWAKWEKETQAKLYPARNSDAFAKAAIEQLALLGDLSIQLQLKEDLSPTYRPEVAPNYDRRRTLGLLTDIRSLSASVLQAQASPSVGYLAVDYWSSTEEVDSALLYTQALKELEAGQGLVIDVRGNRGGDLDLALEMAGHFLNGPVVYAKTATVSEGRVGTPKDLSAEPIRPRYNKPVALLQGTTNMGVNEAFVLVMQNGAQVRTFGGPTYGAAGETTLVDLGNDTRLHLPTLLTMDNQGSVYEGQGLAPDQLVPWADQGDPVLAAALAWLETQKG